MQTNKKTFFSIKEKGSTVGREILAGLVIFLAMIYILPTNVGVLGDANGANMNPSAVFIATAISSAVATLIMGLIAKFPIALSAGMGLNAFFSYTVCGAMGYSWQEALTITLVAAIIFIILTFTPLRKMIIEAIPLSLKSAIIAGLGCFIAFVGLKNMGFIVSDAATLVRLGDLGNPSLLLGLLGIILVIICLNLNGKIKNFAIVIAMFSTATIGFILGLLGVDGMPTFSGSADGLNSLGETFGEAFLNFGVLAKPQTYAIIFSFVFVNLFDTTATLLSVGHSAGALNEKGEMVGGQKVMIADAVGGIVGGVLGTSPVTSFAESNTGIEVGGRTGLTAVTTGILFLLSIFAYPLFSIFTYPAVTGMALVAIGSMMFSHLKDIEWNDKIIVFTSFIMILFMIICYSISDGLGFGLIFYSIMMLVSKRGKEVKPTLYVISILYVISYVIGVFVL